MRFQAKNSVETVFLTFCLKTSSTSFKMQVVMVTVGVRAGRFPSITELIINANRSEIFEIAIYKILPLFFCPQIISHTTEGSWIGLQDYQWWSSLWTWPFERPPKCRIDHMLNVAFDLSPCAGGQIHLPTVTKMKNYHSYKAKLSSFTSVVTDLSLWHHNCGRYLLENHTGQTF